MDHVTLIVVPDERSPVRRLRVPAPLIRFGPWGAVAFAALFAVLLADWVSLRIDTWDLAALRVKAERDREQLSALADDLGELEGRLQRFADFERKVRVIADLPAALPETQTPAVPAAASASAARLTAPSVEGGQGGSDEAEPNAAPVSAPPARELMAPDPPLGLDSGALRQMRARTHALAVRIEKRGGMLEELVSKLRSVRDRLASTPSIWPANGFVTSGYGWRLSPFTGRRHFHAGLDIAADTGTDIVAAARGRVSFAGKKGAFGQIVIVDHGFGIQTMYGHTSAIHVEKGQTVERGQRIAAVGSTGRSTGPHLHYAVQLKGRSVNPADYVLE
jgi:murein DD-endopeptidase MepM/ murein hydrolase activator NlpD